MKPEPSVMTAVVRGVHVMHHLGLGTRLPNGNSESRKSQKEREKERVHMALRLHVYVSVCHWPLCSRAS